MKKLVYFLCFLAAAYGCDAGKKKYCDYERPKIELRDSLQIVYTLRAWCDTDWFLYRNLNKFYSINMDDVSFFVDACFYSPDKKRLIAWIGYRTPNGSSRIAYKKEPKLNRMCPVGADTIYMMDGLIGFRDDTNGLWHLYPFNEQMVECAGILNKAEEIMYAYYFKRMPEDRFYNIVQSGPQKGMFSNAAYGYTVTDTNFWTKSPIWQKDTVRSYGLYPFQVDNYAYGVQEFCKDKDCAVPQTPPKVQYPDYILRMFKDQ